MKLYEIYAGDELKVAEKIQQRRYQILIHSCIYYSMDQNIVSDDQWNTWSEELKKLQNTYPDISKHVTLYDYFKDWDGSTGAFLPIELDWVVKKAKYLLELHADPVVEVKKESKRRLF